MSAADRYRTRRRRVYSYLRDHGYQAAVIADFEGLRNRSLRYLCGHPGDALLFLFAEDGTLRDSEDATLRDAEDGTLRDSEDATLRDGEDATPRDAEDGTLRDSEDATLRDGEDATLRDAEDATLRDGGGSCLLVAWDVPLAESLATVDRLVPYTSYGRSLSAAIKGVFTEGKVRRAELSEALPYPVVRKLSEALPALQLDCREGGIDRHLKDLRAVKDAEEIELLRRACRLTDELLGRIPQLLGRGASRSELELALFLEAQARRGGAEGTGFETLAASASRSFAIHCHPSYTAAAFGTSGLSILDFGVRVEGYTSDVTLTALRRPLSRKQEEMAAAVQEAYELAVSLCRPGANPVRIAGRVQELLERRGFQLPHALGHGIGLDAHEAPLFRVPKEADEQARAQLLEPGMVFALEPGAYDPREGGVRLENDFLCTEQGVEALTSARLLHLDA